MVIVLFFKRSNDEALPLSSVSSIANVQLSGIPVRSGFDSRQSTQQTTTSS